MIRLRNDLSGTKVNFLAVLGKTKNPLYKGAVYYDCQCKCGKLLSVRSHTLRKSKIISCGCQKAKDWSGFLVNDILVIKHSERKGYWHCLCQKCNNPCVISTNSLRSGITRTCGCLKYLLQDKNPHWNGFGEISGAFFCKKRDSAKSRGIKFSVTIQEIWDLFLKQNRKCALTGEEISFSNQTASLDRIDSSKNYTTDNIQWVDKRINIMKRSLKQEEFIDLCRKIVLKNS